MRRGQDVLAGGVLLGGKFSDGVLRAFARTARSRRLHRQVAFCRAGAAVAIQSLDRIENQNRALLLASKRLALRPTIPIASSLLPGASLLAGVEKFARIFRRLGCDASVPQPVTFFAWIVSPVVLGTPVSKSTDI